MYSMLSVKKTRFLFTAALGDGPVVPHFCKAQFAASRADAVPRPKQLSQDVLLTARLQGTRHKTQSEMLRETNLHQNTG